MIGGVDLLELIADAEIPHVRRERTQRGLAPDDFLPGDYLPWCLLDRDSYLGQPGNSGFDFAEGDPRATKTELFDCSCGCSGCWPLVASIFVFASHVVWANFEQIPATARPSEA